MAEFNFTNLAKNLPDCYKKDKQSNNYKILEIERHAGEKLRNCLCEIENILDIENARGVVLDAYGERFGQPRGRATDEQYRVMIKSKIIRNLSNGSYLDVINAISVSFGCSVDDVVLTELKDEPMTVTLEKVPLTAIVKAGFTTSQACQIVKSLLPVGVKLKSVLFDGTFEFSSVEDEYDELAGFADDAGTIGGYFGATEGDVKDTPLPL